VTKSDRKPPLVVHIVFALRVGGLENGLVNLINRTPKERFRHAVICLSHYDAFAERLEDSEVPLIALHKREGKNPSLYWRLWRELRRLKPDIVHTRNLAALDANLIAALAGVPVRVHGEHGRDMVDLDGTNRKYRWLRRALSPLIHRFIPLSTDLEAYLHDSVGIPDGRITRITNGVDVDRFHPDEEERPGFRNARGWDAQTLVIGWVGRMESVKNPLGLVEAFIQLVRDHPSQREQVALVMIGDGSLSGEVASRLQQAGLTDRVWLPGSREDVPDLLRALDLFALPSLAEGISNTVLEAMASGVPVVATRVGGNPELVDPERAGELVEADDPEALSEALAGYLGVPQRLAQERQAAREWVLERFSIDTMVTAYLDLYQALLPASKRLLTNPHGVSG
jgi:sugar transferase (PEP-CTERM/EpsH1 system associated)